MKWTLKEASKISHYLLCILICTLVNVSAVAQNTSVTTTGNNSPSVIADKIAITYGVKPKIVEELIKVYEQAGLTVEARRNKVEDIIKTYKNLPQQSEALSEEAKQKLGIQHNEAITNILNWDIFLSTKGKNSPAVYALGGYVEIWYGISPEVFKGIYNLLETKQVAIDEFEKKLKEQINKYVELEKELSLREDEMAHEAKKYLEKGEIEEAKRILRDRIYFLNKKRKRSEISEAIAYFDYGKMLEFELKFDSARIMFLEAINLAPINTLFILNYANQLLNLEQYKLAIEQYQHALKVDSIYNESSLKDMFHFYLGDAYQKKGEYNKAEENYEEAKKLVLKKSDRTQRHLGEIYWGLGVVLYSKGKFTEALAQYKKALDICNTEIGNANLTAANLQNNLGLCYLEIGEYILSNDYFQKSFSFFQKLNITIHPDLANLYNNTGSLLYRVGKFEEALLNYKKALDIDLKIFGEFHTKIAYSYTNIGVALSELNQYDQAELFLINAENISLRIFGEEHPILAAQFNNLGLIETHRGNTSNAIAYHEKALEILTKSYAEFHPEIATTYHNLGIAYKGSKKAEEENLSMYFFEKAVSIFIKNFGELHPNVASVYIDIGSFYEAKEDFNNADTFYKKALSICQKLFPLDHPFIKYISNSIERVSLKKKN